MSSPLDFLSPVLSAVGDFGGTLLSGHLNRRSARSQMKFQQSMRDTAYQAAAADLEKAGLNRVLALGSPAASPSGAQGITPASSPGTSYQGAASAKATRDLMADQQTNTKADTMKKISEGELADQSIRESVSREKQNNANTALSLVQAREGEARIPTYATSMDLSRADAAKKRQETETEKHRTKRESDFKDVTNVMTRGAQVVSPVLDILLEDVISPVTSGARDFLRKDGSLSRYLRQGGWLNLRRDLNIK